MAEKSADKTSKRKNRAIFIIFPIIVFIGAVTIFFYLRYKKTHVSTDDAYVDGRIHTIASKVPGRPCSVSILKITSSLRQAICF
jgi:membrane fusion protein (multidrug efflux system)